MSPGPTASHETTQNQLPELFLEGVDKNMADEIVRFAYTGDIRYVSLPSGLAKQLNNLTTNL